MIPREVVARLSQSTERQCLTLYFNTGPDYPHNTFHARFHNLVRGLEPQVVSAARKPFERVLTKLANFLEQYRPVGNSLFAVATEPTLEQFPSRVPVRDEIWWGRPNIAQLLWLLEEYRPYGVLIADQRSVRFLAVRLNEFEEFKEFTAEIDTSEWRRQRIGVSSRGGAVLKGGRNIDSFSSRYWEHVHGFWRQLHRPLTELTERYHVHRLVIAGNRSLIPEFIKSLPAQLSASVITQVPLENFTGPTEAVKRIFPEIEAWERKREQQLVTELLSAASISRGLPLKAAVGLEPTLKFLQEGRASRLIIVRGFDRQVGECPKCGHISASAHLACGRCAEKGLRTVSAAAVLPRLVAQFRVPIETVAGPAGAELNKNGGVGVLLRF